MESIDTETTTHVVYAAVLATKLIGGSLALAVLGAMWDAVSPESLTWVTTHGISSLSVAFRLLMLVTLLTPFYRLLVTYLHLGHSRHTIVRRGRHRPEYVRTHQASAWQART